MCRTILPPKQSRYYARHRKHHFPGGAPCSALMTRYAWDTGLRAVTGPRGGKAYQKFNRIAYYHDGIFYRDMRMTEYADERAWEAGEGTISHVLVPITGTIWDCYQTQSLEQGIPVASIECVEGVPISVKSEGVTIWQRPNLSQLVIDWDWYETATILGLNKEPRKRSA